MSPELLILTNTDGPTWQRSIGAYQVAHHCREHGFTCQVIDFTDYFTLNELEQLLEHYVGEQTLAIGVSTSFYYNNDTKKKYVSASRNFETVIPPNIRQLLQDVKIKFSNVKIIAGGANSYRAIDDDLFDVVFHGYSEQSVVEYLEFLKTKRKRIWPRYRNKDIIDGATAHFDISSLNHRWHKTDCVLPGETLPIEISRGCIFKCKFCSYPLNGKKKFDYLRDPERIRDELLKNYEMYGTTNYFFTDDTFNDSTYKLRKLHQAITSLPFKIKFVTYLRLDLIHAHPEQIQLLYEMGLGSAFFGIESLNAASSRAIGKGMKPELIKEFLVELHDVHWKKQIPITCSFIIGLPNETVETVTSTYQWIKTAPVNDLWFPLFIKADSFFKSEFDINFLEYGYKLDEKGNWYNQNMDYHTALALAEQFNQTGFYTDKFPSSWFLFTLLSYGYTIAELKDIPIKNLSWFSLTRKKLGLVKLYKKKLFETIRLAQ